MRVFLGTKSLVLNIAFRLLVWIHMFFFGCEDSVLCGYWEAWGVVRVSFPAGWIFSLFPILVFFFDVIVMQTSSLK